MNDSKIRVLLVDDSSFMRLVVADILETSKRITVVATAENGKEAHEKTRQYRPDVVLLDLTMQEYDGLYAVRHIMQECPTPIVILSALGNTNARAVFEAMEAGAYDFLNKPQNERGARIRDLDNQLIAKIEQAATVNRSQLTIRKSNENTHPHTFDSHLSYDLVAIGASTGGTGAIEEILRRLPSNFPVPVVIAQHMPAGFVHSFARRLHDMLPLPVKVVQPGDLLTNGRIYILPGDQNTVIQAAPNTGVRTVAHTDQVFPEFNGPSVDGLFLSVAEVYRSRAIGVVLSGMGKDGAAGMQALHRHHALTIAQDEKTCVVFGMPKVAVERGAVRQVLPVHEIAGYIVSSLS